MVLVEDIKRFYNYFKHENKTEIRVFDKIKYPNGKSVWVKNESDFVKQVELYQNEGVDVFIGFRDRKAKGDKNVTSSGEIFFEVDEHDIKKPEQKEKIEQMLKRKGIEIGMSGLSGGGFHFYIPHKMKYIFSEDDGLYYKKVLNAFKEGLIEEGINIDPAVFNLERVSRVLGTKNLKRKAQSKILIYNDNIDRDKNHLAIKKFILQYEKKEVKIDKNALEILEKHKIDNTDKWLYDLLKKKVMIKSDTGGNSVVFKNASIILTRENISMEEIKVVGKALSDLCEGRTLTAFIGWIKKAKRNELSEVNEYEINKLISENNYTLTEYSLNKKETPTRIEELQVRTYEDFKKLKKNKNYLVEDFLFPGNVVMVHSPPAQFKSLLAQSLSLSLSNGKNWLGFKTKKSPVLYLDGENADQLIKERLEQIHNGMNLKRNKFPFYVLKGGELITQRKEVHFGFMLALEKVIEEKGIKVLIFDTLHRFAFYDENKSDDINLLYTKVFKPLVRDYGVSIIFLHHSKKDGGYRGSGDFLGSVDVAYKISRTGKTNKFVIVNEKCRSGEIGNINGEIDFGEDYIKFYRRDEEEETENKINKLKEITERVQNLLQPGAEMRRKEIVEVLEMQKFNYGDIKSVTRALKFLCDTGKFDKTGHGIYRRNL